MLYTGRVVIISQTSKIRYSVPYATEKGRER